MDEQSAYPVFDPEQLFQRRQQQLLTYARIPLRTVSRERQAELWQDGFLGNRALMYDFAAHGAAPYLSDLQREMTRLLNGRHGFVLNDKLVFASVYRSFPQAEVLAFSEAGRLETLAPLKGDAFVKPTLGGAGKAVRRVTLPDFEPLDVPYIITRAVPQHPRLDVFPTVNTVRVLMTGPHVAAAVWRVGTGASGGVDNFSKGGLSLAIDAETGIVGLGARKNTRPSITHHPDTGARLTGLQLPFWAETLALAHAAFAHFPALRYVGWDIVISPTGPVLLEGNSFSDVHLLQVHRPLLADSRVREFYHRHGTLEHRPTLPFVP